jgi:anti-anti-sigma regulatory factor
MLTKSEITLSLHGAQSIYQAPAIKTQLLKALETENSVYIDCKDINKIDLSILQLLIATQKETLGTSQKITFNLELPDTLQPMVSHSGFNKFLQPLTSQ